MINQYIPRAIEPFLVENLNKGRAIIIYGPRQVGKTTLARRLLTHYESDEIVEYQADDPTQAALFTATVDSLTRIVAGKKVLFVDEAQSIKNAGLVFKLLVDTFPNVQVIATGSSSFELSDKVKESMVGRALEITLLPLSAEELSPTTKEKLLFNFERALQLGGYPAVTLNHDIEAKERLQAIVNSYLYKDVLTLADTRNPEVLGKLLTALALQVGQEVSYNELATMLEVSRPTIERYLYLLEQCFVIFRLYPLSSNPRKLLTSRKRKIYFYDVGVRNALAGQLDISVVDQQQLGGVFENFCIAERLKARLNHQIRAHVHYWRSPDSELDYIEQYNGSVHAYEIKWRKRPKNPPPRFARQFPDALFTPVTKDTFWSFLETRP
jgi:predicted AAA+ superfamily ATPase